MYIFYSTHIYVEQLIKYNEGLYTDDDNRPFTFSNTRVTESKHNNPQGHHHHHHWPRLPVYFRK